MATSTRALAVQLLGLLLLCIGIGLADVPAAIAAGGFGLIVFGISAELGDQAKDDSKHDDESE
jgi:hypothetical protein